MRFGICLAVRSLLGVPKSRFSFQPIPALDHHGVDVARDDIFMNLVTKDDQLMNGNLPWRGPREKSVLLMQMLIEASTFPGDLVVDCTAATGSFSQPTPYSGSVYYHQGFNSILFVHSFNN
jgi:hypothetical protein